MKKFYAVRYKQIYNDGSIIEVGALKNEIFEKIEEAIEYANKRNAHIWKFHQNKTNNSFYFVVEIEIPKELL